MRRVLNGIGTAENAVDATWAAIHHHKKEVTLKYMHELCRILREY